MPENPLRRLFRPWLPAFAALAVIVLGLLLFRALSRHEEEQMERKTALAAENMAAALEAAMRTRVLALSRVASRWSGAEGPDEQQFRRDAAWLQRDLGGYEAVVWVDGDRINRWIEPLEPNRFLEGQPVALDERRAEAFERARREGTPAITRTVRIANGKGTGFLAWVPVTGAGTGYVLGVFLVEGFVESVVEKAGGLSGYSLEVYDGDQLVHARIEPRLGGGRGRGRAAEAAFYGASWRVELRPLPETVEAERSPLPYVAAGGAFLVALLLAAAVRQAQVARDRAHEAERARASLEEASVLRERATAALHRSEALYRTLAAHLPDAAVFLFDRDLRYLLAEGPLLAGLRLANVSLEGKTLGERLPAEVAARLLPLYVGALEGRARREEIQFQERWFSLDVTPVRNEAGEIYAGMVLAQEITERRVADDELRAAAARLEASNRELQDFAYIASHDLQEPLRKVQAFGDRIRSRYGAALDEEGRDYLQRMLGAATRMRELLEGLLRFSRVSTEARPFERCDLGAVARQVLSDLEVRIEETGAVVELFDLPAIEADPLQMRQLLQNLVANALKFTEPGTPPRVHVSGRMVREGSEVFCELSVADEGIGFDERYLEKIFAVFQRLHGRGTYEGSGVGLAICRKIVARHGGTITARSRPGEGATFVVRLPAGQAGARPVGAAA